MSRRFGGGHQAPLHRRHSTIPQVLSYITVCYEKEKSTYFAKAPMTVTVRIAYPRYHSSIIHGQSKDSWGRGVEKWWLLSIAVYLAKLLISFIHAIKCMWFVSGAFFFLIVAGASIQWMYWIAPMQSKWDYGQKWKFGVARALHQSIVERSRIHRIGQLAKLRL